jgi:hypothetical protein
MAEGPAIRAGTRTTAVRYQNLRRRCMAAARKTAKRKSPKRKAAAKRELIAPRGDKRYVRRDAKGRIKESVDVGRSLSADRRRKAKTVVKAGQGDRGDERP